MTSDLDFTYVNPDDVYTSFKVVFRTVWDIQNALAGPQLEHVKFTEQDYAELRNLEFSQTLEISRIIIRAYKREHGD